MNDEVLVGIGPTAQTRGNSSRRSRCELARVAVGVDWISADYSMTSTGGLVVLPARSVARFRMVELREDLSLGAEAPDIRPYRARAE